MSSLIVVVLGPWGAGGVITETLFCGIVLPRIVYVCLKCQVTKKNHVQVVMYRYEYNMHV